MVELNKLYCGDANDLLYEVGDETIDMVVTSPPYDSLRHYNGSMSAWNHDKFKTIADELYRVIKEGGVVVWNVNDKTENGSKTGTSFKQALYFMDIGFSLNDTMIWRKTNPMPQVKQPRYVSCFEYMFVFSKGKPKTFNPIMRKTLHGGNTYNSTCKNMGGENGRTFKNFKINEYAVEYNVWDIGVAQNKTNHPAVYPYEIPYRHIKSWTNEGDTVLDPFMGSGTTALACIDLNRNFIGFDTNQEYIDEANTRIEAKMAEKS